MSTKARRRTHKRSLKRHARNERMSMIGRDITKLRDRILKEWIELDAYLPIVSNVKRNGD